MKVRPKKYFGQHFLTDQNIASKIAGALNVSGCDVALEVGPGMGVLTRHILSTHIKSLTLIEIDKESVEYLTKHFEDDRIRLIEGDFLKLNLPDLFESQVSVIGNFPYNISSQIFFKVIENKAMIPEVVGMVQKEVAQRICSPSGNKVYGLLSVLLGAFYDAKLLFKVPPGVFNPPPKVDSAVIRLVRKEVFELNCDEALFMKIVKRAFQNRRKTLRNALKEILLPAGLLHLEILSKRAEQLVVQDFVDITSKVEQSGTAGNEI